MLAKAEVHEYNIVQYNDPLVDLVTPFYVEGERIATEKEGKYKALIISFSLKPSCYATMFLREVMREGRDLNRAEEKAAAEPGEEEEEEKEVPLP